jgi:glycine oxidase
MRVGIIGAGLLGKLLAYTLKEKSYDLMIITAGDKQANDSAAYVAAGMLTPMIELDQSEPIIKQLGIDSIERWKTILSTLKKKVFSQFNGSILTAHPGDQAELQSFIKRVQSKLPKHEFQELNSTSIQQFEPELNLKSGLYFPVDGHIEAHSLMSALNYELEYLPITWHTHTAVNKIEGTCAFSNSKKYTFDMIFDCRGYGAKDMFPSLRGVRGELLYLHAPDVKLKHPIRLLTPRYPIYIVPLSDQRYIVGASQIETEDRSEISVRSCLELLTAAYSIHSGFAEARIIQSAVGLRPALPSNLPQIKFRSGVIAINGLYRHGFLLAPAVVDQAIKLFESGIESVTYPELLNGAEHD